MQTLTFKLLIHATAAEIWPCICEPEHYKVWTNVFCAGSYYKTDSFTQGSKIHFLSPNGEGMYSLIDTLEENKLIVFKHLGIIKEFEEMPIDEEAQQWNNALERYELIPQEHGTELLVQVDTLEKYVDYMNTTFPAAMQQIKVLAEQNK